MSDLITDHFNRAVDPPLWPNPKHVGRNPATTGCISHGGITRCYVRRAGTVAVSYFAAQRFIVVFSGASADARSGLSVSAVKS